MATAIAVAVVVAVAVRMRVREALVVGDEKKICLTSVNTGVGCV